MSNVFAIHSAGHRFDDNDAVTRQGIVDSLKRSLDGLGRADSFHVHFSDAIEHRVWELDRQLGAGSRVEPMSFHEFVTRPFPEGLGTDHDTIRRLLAGTPLFNEYDALLVRGSGNPTGTNQHAVRGEGGTFDNIQGSSQVPKAPTGTSEAAGIRRLRKAADAGDSRAQQQLEDVLRGSTSVHRACVEMGWRKPTVTVKDEPVALLEAAAKRATPMEMAIRAWRLMSEDDRKSFLNWTENNG